MSDPTPQWMHDNEEGVAHEVHGHLGESERAVLTISVTRSAGDDRAITVFIDTDFEPDGSDEGPGLRILLNDDEAYVGKAYDFGGHHEAKSVELQVALKDIDYTGKEVD